MGTSIEIKTELEWEFRQEPSCRRLGIMNECTEKQTDYQDKECGDSLTTESGVREAGCVERGDEFVTISGHYSYNPVRDKRVFMVENAI